MRWLLFFVVVSSPLWAADVPRPRPLPTPEQIASCGPDALRWCSAFIKNGQAQPGMDSCMLGHRLLLSQACREVFK